MRRRKELEQQQDVEGCSIFASNLLSSDNENDFIATRHNHSYLFEAFVCDPKHFELRQLLIEH
jgi:hypothetical protein